MKFKKFSTRKEIEENLIDYVRNFLSANPNSKISIGTDSKYKSKLDKAIYATVLVFSYPGIDGVFNKGSHLIYSIERVDKKLSLFERLWFEVDRSRIIADLLKEKLGIKIEIHVDLNPNKKYKSNVAYSSAIGMLTGLGYLVHAKPDAPAATCAADLLVNNYLL